MSNRFTNSIVLITGGTSGIGLTTALEFIKEGASRVIVCGRSPAKWQTAQGYLRPRLSSLQMNRIEYRSCDVRVEGEIQSLIGSIFDQYNRLDACVNCAGIQPVNSGDIRDENFSSYKEKDGSIVFYLGSPPCLSGQTTPVSLFCENPIATSVLGIFYSLKWQITYSMQSGLPMSIVNISSRNGVIPDSHRPLYAASKAFILSLTQSVAAQVAEKNAPIRVNAVSPGPIDTPLERAAFPGSDSDFQFHASMGVPMGRVGTTDNVASAILFLSDPKTSSYITGTNLSVDGGHVGAPVLGSAMGKYKLIRDLNGHETPNMNKITMMNSTNKRHETYFTPKTKYNCL